MRASAIASSLASAEPSIHQLILTTANYSEHLRRLRSSVLVLPSHFESPSAAHECRRAHSLPASLLEALVLDGLVVYAPSLVLFDTYASRRLSLSLKRAGLRVALTLRECGDAYILKLAADRRLDPFDLMNGTAPSGRILRGNAYRSPAIRSVVGVSEVRGTNCISGADRRRVGRKG